VEEYAEGFAPGAASSVAPDAAENEWLPEELRAPIGAVREGYV
jgi:hypothetical protein